MSSLGTARREAEPGRSGAGHLCPRSIYGGPLLGGLGAGEDCSGVPPFGTGTVESCVGRGTAREPTGPEVLRRDATTSPLHALVREHLETFLARFQHEHGGRRLPRYVEQELRGLACGDPAHGFCRIHCPHCSADLLVPFSCKGRAFCPSCGGRRMAEVAANLIERMLPPVPVR